MKHKARSLAKLPRLKTDRPAEQFVEGSDLARHDLSSLKATQFEFAAKEARINMRLPGEMLSAVKRAAQQRGVPYQRIAASSSRRRDRMKRGAKLRASEAPRQCPWNSRQN